MTGSGAEETSIIVDLNVKLVESYKNSGEIGRYTKYGPRREHNDDGLLEPGPSTSHR